jgi:NAD-dependent deacetylase
VRGVRRRWSCTATSGACGAPRVAGSRSATTSTKRRGCGGWLRPAVVWFGEVLDPEILLAATDVVRRADVVLVIGTSAVVYPVAALPDIARDRGSRIVEVNVDETPLSARADAVLRGPAGTTLPALAQAL